MLVSDLDGVVRLFDPTLWDELDQLLGRPTGSTIRAFLGNPIIGDVITGRASHAEWRAAIGTRLQDDGASAKQAEEAIDRWLLAAGRLDPKLLELVNVAESRGIACFLFTNGTDRVRDELDALGFREFVPLGRERIINSAELGVAKPDPESFTRAHAGIEAALARHVEPPRVLFLDDRADNVAAARSFGWGSCLVPGV